MTIIGATPVKEFAPKDITSHSIQLLPSLVK